MITGVAFKISLFAVAALAAICIAALYRRHVKVPRLGIGFGLFAALFVLFGSDKSPLGQVIFYRTDPEILWLRDTGSFVSNDVVHVSFQPHAQLPDDAILQMWHAPTNSMESASSWRQYGGDVFLGDAPRQFDIIYTNAMEYAWCFFTTYVRPPISTTNDTIYIEGILDNKSGNAIGIPIHTEIDHNGKTIKNYTQTTNTQKE